LESPKQSIENLIQNVFELSETGTLNHGQGNALIAKLKAAVKQVDRGNDHVAINQLHAFINQVTAMINSGVLLPGDGEPLIAAASAIIAVLSSYP
jgi:hypothetical protein